MTGEKMIKVLVVDDSKAMQTILRRGLNDLGYSNLDIKSCNDGAEALEIVRTWDPDLVLSDWHMPNMNGLQLIQAIKNTEIRGEVIKLLKGNVDRLKFIGSGSVAAGNLVEAAVIQLEHQLRIRAGMIGITGS